MRTMLSIAVAALILSGSATAQPRWTFEGGLGASFDDNAGNAHSEDDLRKVSAAQLSGAASTNLYRGAFSALQLRAQLDGEADSGVGDLSNARAGLRLRWLQKPGRDFFVPVLALAIGGEWKQSASEIRTGSAVRVNAYLDQPITTQIRARISVNALRREAKGRTFDASSRGASLSLDWLLPVGVTLYGEFALEDGPIVTSAEGSGITPKTEHLYLQNVADRIEPDPAFGDQWNAFRVDATTKLWTLGLNWPLTSTLALDAQVRRADAVADTSYTTATFTGYEYRRLQGGLGLLYRF